MVEKLDAGVLSLLLIRTEPIFDSNNSGTAAEEANEAKSSAAYFTAWSAFRNIAYVFIIIIGLVMVASQVLGFEWFSAYTIRKMLPKLLLAVFFIAASWRVMEFLFNASNALAAASQSVIKAPFSTLDAGLGTGAGDLTLGALMAVLLVVGAGVGAAVIAIAGFGAVGALILSAALAVFSAWVILITRNTVATMLIIASPVPIALWAFEPGKKVFTIWKAITATILISVPAVAAFLQVSHVAALVTYISGGATGAVVATIILLAAYGLILTIMRKLDSTWAAVGGVTQQATGKLQNQLKQYRGNQLKQNMGRFQMGDRFHGKYTSGLNNVGLAAGAFMRSNEKGEFLHRGTRRSAIETQRRIAAMHAANTDEAKVTQYDDLQQRAQMFRSEDDARARMRSVFGGTEQDVEAGIAAARANGGWSVGNRIKAFEAAAASGTSFNTWRDALTMGTDIAGDDVNIRNQLSAKLKQNSVGAGRTDFGAGIGDIIGAMNDVHANGQNSAYLDGQELTMKALTSQDSASYMRGKPVSVEIGGQALANEMATQERIFQTGNATEQASARRQLTILNNLATDLRAGTAYSSSDNKVSLSENALNPSRDVRERATQIANNQTVQTVPDTSQPLYNNQGQIIPGQFAQRPVVVNNPVPRPSNPVTGDFGYDPRAASLNENIQNPYARNPGDLNDPNNPNRRP